MQYNTSTGSLKGKTYLVQYPNVAAKSDPDSHFGLDDTYNQYTANENKKAFKYTMNFALGLLLGPAVESFELGGVGASTTNILLKATVKAPAAANTAMIFLTQRTIQAGLVAGGAGAIEGTLKSIYGPDPESNSSIFMNPSSDFGMNAAQGFWNGWAVLKGSNPLPNP